MTPDKRCEMTVIIKDPFKQDGQCKRAAIRVVKGQSLCDQHAETVEKRLRADKMVLTTRYVTSRQEAERIEGEIANLRSRLTILESSIAGMGNKLREEGIDPAKLYEDVRS